MKSEDDNVKSDPIKLSIKLLLESRKSTKTKKLENNKIRVKKVLIILLHLCLEYPKKKIYKNLFI
jgi:hypothetical protein